MVVLLLLPCRNHHVAHCNMLGDKESDVHVGNYGFAPLHERTYTSIHRTLQLLPFFGVAPAGCGLHMCTGN